MQSVANRSDTQQDLLTVLEISHSTLVKGVGSPYQHSHITVNSPYRTFNS